MEKRKPNIQLSLANFAQYNESVVQKNDLTGSFRTDYDFSGKIFLKKEVIEQLEMDYKDRWIMLDGYKYNASKPVYNHIDLEKNGATLVSLFLHRKVDTAS